MSSCLASTDCWPSLGAQFKIVRLERWMKTLVRFQKTCSRRRQSARSRFVLNHMARTNIHGYGTIEVILKEVGLCLDLRLG